MEGDQVGWSRWCGQKGSWRGSMLDRSGFTGEKPTNKDIRFPSDVCKHRAFARFCGRWSERSTLLCRLSGAGALCPAIVLICLSFIQFSRQPSRSECYRTSMDEKTAPSKDTVWSWGTRRRQNLISSMICWSVFLLFTSQTCSYTMEMSSVDLCSVPDPHCLFGSPASSRFSHLPHCFSAHFSYGIPIASHVDLIPIAAKDIHTLPSLLSSNFYFQAPARLPARYFSGISNTTCPKLNSFSSPLEPASLLFPVLVMSPPFKKNTYLPWTSPHSPLMSSQSSHLDHATCEMSAESLYFSLSSLC